MTDDPHSPHGYGGGIFGVIAGWWHAHVGWMVTADLDDLGRYVGDLQRDRTARWIDKLFVVWVAVGLLIPTVIGGLVTGTWVGALLGFLWGGLVRVFFVHHATFSINSVCHLWGRKPYKCNDESRNNFLCGVLGLGEGWHNNHHAFSSSARHGLRWWEVDFSYLVIRSLSVVGLAWKVQVPSPEQMERRRARAAGEHTPEEAPPPLEDYKVRDASDVSKIAPDTQAVARPGAAHKESKRVGSTLDR